MNSKILVLVVLIIILIFFQGLSYPTRLLQWLARCSFDPVLFEQWEDVCRAELLSFVFFLVMWVPAFGLDVRLRLLMHADALMYYYFVSKLGRIWKSWISLSSGVLCSFFSISG